MAIIVEPGIERYLETLGTGSDPVLAEMEKLAEERGFPIVGPQVGALLAILARTTGARRILELGSGYGYSAYWMARELPPGGRVHCTELDPTNRDLALGYLARGGLADRVSYHVGDALGYARTLTGPYDLIFNDIDKHAYPESVSVALPLLRLGGLFITDNALWSGKVADERTADKTTAAVREFNHIVTHHPSLRTVILPIRDGVAVAARIA